MVGWMGDKYEIQLRSQWDSPFSKTSIGEGVSALGKWIGGKNMPDTGGLVDSVLGTSGVGSRLKQQTAQVWQSTDPLSFSFEFNFAAINNAADEVTSKLVALLKLAAPSEMDVGGLIGIRAPGPIVGQKMLKTAGDATGFFDVKSRKITLHIGNFMVLEDIIVTSVSSAISGLVDVNGNPIFAAVNLSVESFFSCFTVQDIDKAFAPGLKFATQSAPTPMP
jgi:hypothetical protein